MEQSFLSAVRMKKSPPKDSYLLELPAVQHLINVKQMEFSCPVTFFAGENGTGKSTLLEAIAVAYGFNPEGGSRNFNFSTSATHSDLHSTLTIIKRAYPKDGFFLRAESFYNASSYIDMLDEIPASSPPISSSYGGSLHKKSHGESFLALVQNRFSGNGIYFFDEPEAALSPSRIMTLICEIHRLVNCRSQFIIATHSPILMAYPGAQILEFSENGICEVDYRRTEHYQLTRRFLENPEAMLKRLLEDE